MGMDMAEYVKSLQWKNRRACDVYGMKEDIVFPKDENGKRPLYLCYRHKEVFKKDEKTKSIS